MAGRSWLVDGNRFATKIKSASSSCDPGRINWKSHPSRVCSNCQHVFDNSDVTQEWPGLPRGVKFDPSDQELICHLLAKSGAHNFEPHPFINEFIPTVEEDDGICYTHPQNLPGVKQDGSVSHFFHRAVKAYNTGTRKRRKIHGDDLGDVRWHKTGKTKPVVLDGTQRGCKKIMVLYTTHVRGGKADKTKWVMHQYHLGTGEDEKEGDYVISKVFHQQQQTKQSDKSEVYSPERNDTTLLKVDAVSPKSVTPEVPCERRYTEGDLNATFGTSRVEHSEVECLKDVVAAAFEMPDNHERFAADDDCYQMADDNRTAENDAYQIRDDNENQAGEDVNDWDSGSQYLLNSQQLVEALSLCDEFLQSQSPSRSGVENQESKSKPRLSDYARLGPESLKSDLEECRALIPDLANIETDTPPDFRLSQLEFGSQDSFVPWGGN